ncbi:MAG: RNA polymerase sigma factor [Candidatus Glassbacteria bacterium]|nr:RNA polymerase sigma factor [Candidatus Glassbacteria bacterium]
MAETKSRETADRQNESAASSSSGQWPDTWPETSGEYENLVDCMIRPLVRYAFRRLHCLADAEDVVQDVLVKAFAIWHKRRGKTGVAAYLYRMTANTCTDLYRRENMIRRKYTQEGAFAVIDGAGQTEREALAELERIEGLLQALPRRQAEVIRLRVVDELSFIQIARTLDIKLPTAKSRFHYGISKLRKKISALEEVE